MWCSWIWGLQFESSTWTIFWNSPCKHSTLQGCLIGLKLGSGRGSVLWSLADRIVRGLVVVCPGT